MGSATACDLTLDPEIRKLTPSQITYPGSSRALGGPPHTLHVRTAEAVRFAGNGGTGHVRRTSCSWVFRAQPSVEMWTRSAGEVPEPAAALRRSGRVTSRRAHADGRFA